MQNKHDSNSNTSTSTRLSNTLLEYVNQIVRGSLSGINDVFQTALHPIDNLLYPVAMIVYDAYIIAAMHVNNGDDDLLEVQRYLSANKHFYENSVNRMQAISEGFKQAGREFIAASGAERAGTISQVTVGTLAPGFMIKHFAKVRQAVAQLPAAEPFLQRPVFHNVLDTNVPASPALNYLNASDILSQPGTKIYNFVITTDEQLLMIPKAIETAQLNPQGRFILREVHHHELAQLQPVLAAGEFYVIDGVLDSINSLSGHYKPHDILFKSPLKPFVEKKFLQTGFENALGKYMAIFSGELLPPPPSVWGIYPIAMIASATDLTMTACSPLDIAYDAFLNSQVQGANDTLPITAGYIKDALIASYDIVTNAFFLAKKQLENSNLFFPAAVAGENNPDDLPQTLSFFQQPTTLLEDTGNQQQYVGVFFTPELGKVEINYLYRGDKRWPQTIFKEGFLAWGSDLDIEKHLTGNPNSAYVSTSSSKAVARHFPLDLTANYPVVGTKSFIYVINPIADAVDIARLVKNAPTEFEFSVPHGIKPQDIKGVWHVEVEYRGIINVRLEKVDKFFKANPHYIAPVTPPAPTFGVGIKAIGYGLTAAGIAFDGVSLYQAYQDSQRSNNHDRLFDEGARIIGGWTGAYKLGTALGKQSYDWCKPFGAKVQVACATAGSIIGSTLGYLGGSELARNLFPSALAGDDSTGQSKTSEPESAFIGVIFGNNHHPAQISYLYRGDSRVPQSIHPEGFRARGSNPDLFLHVHSPVFESSKSAYISTSTSKKVASTFPGGMEPHAFVYEINPQKKGINIGDALHPEMKTKLSAQDWKRYNAEQEIAVPKKINAHDIKGAWPVELKQVNGKYKYVIQDTFIPNPVYSAPGAKILQAAKMAGHAGMVLGAAMDGISLYQAYQNSKASGDYDPVFNEGARIIGGWSGAYVVGSAGARAGAALCLPLGPKGMALCATVGAIGGSLLGYFGGGALAQTAQEHQALHELTPSDDVYTHPEQAKVVGERIASGLNSIRDGVGRVIDSIFPDEETSSNESKEEPKTAKDIAQEQAYQTHQQTLATERTARLFHDGLKRNGLNSGFFQTEIPFEYSIFNQPQLINEIQSTLWSTVLPSTPTSTDPASLLAPSQSPLSHIRAAPTHPVLIPTVTHHMNSLGYGIAPVNVPFGNWYVPLSLVNMTQGHMINHLSNTSSTSSSLLESKPRHDFLSPSYLRSSLLPERVQREVGFAVSREIGLTCPDAERAYRNAQFFIGNSYNLSYSEFCDIVKASGLVESYSRFHRFSIYGLDRFNEFLDYCGLDWHRDIGGVATESGIIKDLINSPLQAQVVQEGLYIAFAKDDVPADWNQMFDLCAQSYQMNKNDDEHAFVSIHFNNEGGIYTVLPPALRGTMLEKIITLLDYQMKGFLNGGIFSEDFILNWHKNPNTDEAYLREHLIDLKQYVKNNPEAKALNLHYFSLREALTRLNIKEPKAREDSPYRQPFQTSFRIIAFIEKIERIGNIVRPVYGFRVEYSIEESADYKQFLERSREQQGQYPDDYLSIRQCYEAFAGEVKHTFPKMPFARDMFKLLGASAFMQYMQKTMSAMNKEMMFKQRAPNHQAPFPQALPPIPVRYFKRLDISLTMQAVLDNLFNTDRTRWLVELLNQPETSVLPASFQQALRQAIEAQVQALIAPLLTTLSPVELNEYEIERFTGGAEPILLALIDGLRQKTAALIKDALFFMAPEQRILSDASLLQKLQTAKQHVTTFYEQTRRKWQREQASAAKEAIILNALHSCVKTSYQEALETIQTTAMAHENKAIKCMKIIGLLNQLIPTLREGKPLPAWSIPVSSSNRLKLNTLIETLRLYFSGVTGVLPDDLAQHPEFLQTKMALTHVDSQLRQAQDAKNKAWQQVYALPPRGQDLVRNSPDFQTFDRQINTAIAQLSTQKTTIMDAFYQAIIDYTRMEFFVNERLLADHASFIMPIADELNGQHGALTTRFTLQSMKEIRAKKQAIAQRFLTRSQQAMLDALTQRETQLQQQPATLLKQLEQKHPLTLAEHYTHALFGFTNKDLIAQTGDRFEIMGGCSVDLPNLSSTVFLKGQAFQEAVRLACPDTDETMAEFTFDGKQYAVFHVPVRNACQQEMHAENSRVGMHGETVMHQAALLPIHDVNALIANDKDQLQVADDFGHLPLHMAAQNDNVAMIQRILEFYPQQVNAVNKKGSTPLTVATRFGRFNAVKYLLEQGANPHPVLHNGLFPLFVSIENRHTQISLLLLHYLTPEQASLAMDNGTTPLHLAIRHQLFVEANALIEKGVSLDAKMKTTGWTPFHMAAMIGAADLIKAMLQRQPPLMNLRLESGKTALHLAAETGMLSVIKKIIPYGADINSTTLAGETALTLAIQFGHKDVAEFLATQQPTSLAVVSQQPESMLAAQWGMSAITRLFWKRGAIHEKDLYYVVRNGHVDAVQSLLRLKPELRHALIDGESLLAIAAQYGHFALAEALRADKACAYKTTRSDTLATRSLVHDYILYDEVGMVRMHQHKYPDQWHTKDLGNYSCCVSYAAQVGAHQCLFFFLRSIGMTADLVNDLLARSVMGCHVKNVDLLLQQSHPKQDKFAANQAQLKINEPLKSHKGNYAIHLAVTVGSRDSLEVLLNAGANVAVYNDAHETPFDLAIKHKDDFLLKRLFKLTRPSQWPDELHLIDLEKQPANIRSVLKKHLKRKPVSLASLPRESLIRPNEEQVPLVQPDVQSQPALLRVKNTLALLDLESLLQSIKEDREVRQIFKSNQGGKLWQTVLTLSDTAEQKETILDIFDELNKKAVRPFEYQGEHHILCAVLSANSDEKAFARLTVLQEQFPTYKHNSSFRDSLLKPQDQYHFMQIALKKNFRLVYNALVQIVFKKYLKMDTFFPLHDVILSERWDAMQLLSTNSELMNQHVNKYNEQRQTPLMLAALKGNVKGMEYLLEKGADVRLVDREGQTALFYALEGHHVQAALLLLALSKSSNTCDRYGRTALMTAVTTGLLPVVRVLCKEGNDIQAFDRKGFNALHLAASLGRTKIVEYLVQHGFAIDCFTQPKKKTQTTALMLAALRAHPDTVLALIKLDAELTLKDKQGFNFCDYAILSKQADMLRVIRQLPDYYQPGKHPSLLQAAVMADQAEILQELMLVRADLNVLNEDHQTLFHLAAIYHAIDVNRLLIEAREISLNQYDKLGQTALHYAALQGHVAIIEQLVQAGCDVDRLNHHKKTPLELAVSEGHLGATISLLQFGAHPKGNPLRAGLTPAQTALEQGDIDIALQLVLWGDVTSLTRDARALLPEINQQRITQYIDAFEEALRVNGANTKQIQARRVLSFYQPQALITNPFAQTRPVSSPEIMPKTVSAVIEPNPVLWTAFLAQLKALPATCFSQTAKAFIEKIAEKCTRNHYEPHELAQFLVMVCDVRRVWGEYLCLKLFKASENSQLTSLHDYIVILQLLIALEQDNSLVLQGNTKLNAVIHVIAEFIKSGNVLTFKVSLKAIYQAVLDMRYPQRSIDDVLTVFKNSEHALPDDELTRFKTALLDIMRHRELLAYTSQDTILTLILERQKQLPKQAHVPLDPLLMAYLLTLIKETYQIELYDTQIINCLALIQRRGDLSGRMLQINTGGGKSIIMALVATYCSLFDYYVDVMDTSEYLSERNWNKFSVLFKFLKRDAFIRYASSRELIFELLGDEVLNKNKRGERPFHILLIDEVDNLTIDMRKSSARIAISGENQSISLYVAIYNYMKAQGKQSNVTHLRAWLLKTKAHDAVLRSALETMSDKHLTRLMNGALTAIHTKIKDVDYSVRRVMDTTNAQRDKDDIVIIDRANTGIFQEGSQWEDGIHTFLQIKEKLNVTAESLTAGMMSYRELVKRYLWIIGVSGSLGEEAERNEVAHYFNVDLYNTPPHFPKRLTVLPTKITNHCAERFDAIFQSLMNDRKAGQPALITFFSVKETLDFADFIRDKSGDFTYQVLNGTQSDLMDNLVKTAAEPNRFTIATNIAGRGVDIVLSSKAIKSGGLFKVDTVFSESLRAEIQNQGRTARGNEPGTVVMILSLEDAFFSTMDETLKRAMTQNLHRNQFNPTSVQEAIDQMKQWRTYKTEQYCQQRMLNDRQDELISLKQKQFTAMNKSINTLLNDTRFTTEMLRFLSNFQPDSTDVSSKRAFSTRMQSLCQHAHLLIQHGSLSGWSQFYQQFKAFYLKDMLDCWVNFNHMIKDIDVMTKESVEQVYAIMKKDLDAYTHNPKANIKLFLANILGECYDSPTHISDICGVAFA